ncbi:MAG TPA: Rho termination factor N-terminal domain-containing protein [Thermoleophilaceae bacterium]|nr:Rho termination factor N-terminal domain-containing protein [Thermoleophilaceae bacterium]
MAVLRRTELEASPLADLHAIASELGLESFRTMRKPDLIGAILDAQGGGGDAAEGAAEQPDPDEVPSDETLESPSGTAVRDAEDEEEDTSEGISEDTSEGTSEDDEEQGAVADEPAVEEEPEVVDEVSDEAIASGMLDILTNGSGFIRLDPGGQSREDVYVSPAQIRRCELRSGDELSGPVRPPRRNERHPSLVRVETVNGAAAEPPEQRPWFGDLTAVPPSERLAATTALESVPFGKGSRVAVSGPPGAGATTLLRELANALSQQYPDLAVSVVLAGVRPEEVGEWREGGLAVAGGSFERPAEAQAQAAELTVERAKRLVERGGDAAVIIDALDALPPGVRRRLFGAARATAEGGTLTIVAASGDDPEVLRWASTRIVLEGGGRVAGDASGTLRADRLS